MDNHKSRHGMTNACLKSVQSRWFKLLATAAVLLLTIRALFNSTEQFHDLPALSIPIRQRITAYTAGRCMADYPDLYYEIDRALQHWQRIAETTTITIDATSRKHAAKDPDWTIEFLVHENELYILHGSSQDERAVMFVHLLADTLKEATTIGERLPTIQATMRLSDAAFRSEDHDPNDPVLWWSYTRRRQDTASEALWLVPDMLLYGNHLQTYSQELFLARQHDRPFKDKVPQAVWAGAVKLNPTRKALVDITKDKDWAKVWDINWDTMTGMIAPDRFCEYAFSIYTEGHTYSGRMARVLSCDNVAVVPKMDWLVHYHHLLQPDGPDQNYLPVKSDFTDLEEKVTGLLADPDEAQRIIDNSLATFRNRYTSLAASRCYMRRLIQAYSKIAPEPHLYRPQMDSNDALRLKGRPYEVWLMTHDDYHGEEPEWLVGKPLVS